MRILNRIKKILMNPVPCRVLTICTRRSMIIGCDELTGSLRLHALQVGKLRMVGALHFTRCHTVNRLWVKCRPAGMRASVGC